MQQTKIIVLTCLLMLVVTISGIAQGVCLNKDEAQRVIQSMNSPNDVQNKQLRKEILTMAEKRASAASEIVWKEAKDKTAVVAYNNLGKTQLLRVCELIKTNGWLTKNTIGSDGVAAMLTIISNNRSFAEQLQLYPVLLQAADKGFIEKKIIPTIVDTIRVGVGQPQVFGTQATIRDSVIYLHPLVNEAKVDEWRAKYDLSTLSKSIFLLEMQYKMPVIKSTRLPVSKAVKLKMQEQKSAEANLGIAGSDAEEVLKIETKLVNLNVRVLKNNSKIASELTLEKSDFKVFEDGQPQDVSFFSQIDAPFDLVLVLDFSGSTRSKRDLIKKAAARFIEVTRGIDRVAVVAFATNIKLISDYSTDHSLLIKKINEIEVDGNSMIWNALDFAYDQLIKTESIGRRSAVVIMTDGEDSRFGITFADLFEKVRSNDTTIFPIYLADETMSDADERLRLQSQKALWLLAEETGGTFYRAEKEKDLAKVYEQVADDLAKVYSIGYEPKIETYDGSWHDLQITLPNHPELIVKTRKGYYSK